MPLEITMTHVAAAVHVSDMGGEQTAVKVRLLKYD